MQYQKITRIPLVRGNFLTNKIYFRNMGICSDHLYLLKLLEVVRADIHNCKVSFICEKLTPYQGSFCYFLTFCSVNSLRKANGNLFDHRDDLVAIFFSDSRDVWRIPSMTFWIESLVVFIPTLCLIYMWKDKYHNYTLEIKSKQKSFRNFDTYSSAFTFDHIWLLFGKFFS